MIEEHSGNFEAEMWVIWGNWFMTVGSVNFGGRARSVALLCREIT